MRQFFIIQSQRTMIQRSAAVHFHRLHHFQYLRAQRQRHIRGVCSIEHIFQIFDMQVHTKPRRKLMAEHHGCFGFQNRRASEASPDSLEYVLRVYACLGRQRQRFADCSNVQRYLS